jgi:metal-dependent amidase/aminoacylase/carboxypeptidase family protein
VELKRPGYEVTEGVGGFGVVGIIKNGDGPTVMLRTDLDALPVREQTSLPIASVATTTLPGGGETGVMHACGHDLHMTNVVAVSSYLAENLNLWSGTLMVIGQPAEVKPIEPAVVTVGAIHGGTKHNIIGDSCHLQITVRSYDDAVRSTVLEAIKRRATGIAMAYGAEEPLIEISEGTPALENDRQLAARMTGIFEKTLGAERVTIAEPSMGGEDFSQYGRAGVPIVMYRLGSVLPERLERFKALGMNPPSLHSASYYPDFAVTLQTGFCTMCAGVLDLMKPTTK